jgi:hypothetical protein
VGAPGAWTFTTTTRTDILNGNDPLGSGSFKCGLFLSTSNISTSSTTYAGLTNEVANANGYLTGGIAVAFTLAGTSSVTASFTTSPVWTASGGSIVGRFAGVYKVSGDVIAFCLLDATPADVTTTSGNTLTLNASPFLTLA